MRVPGPRVPEAPPVPQSIAAGLGQGGDGCKCTTKGGRCAGNNNTAGIFSIASGAEGHGYVSYLRVAAGGC